MLDEWMAQVRLTKRGTAAISEKGQHGIAAAVLLDASKKYETTQFSIATPQSYVTAARGGFQHSAMIESRRAHCRLRTRLGCG